MLENVLYAKENLSARWENRCIRLLLSSYFLGAMLINDMEIE